MRVSKTAEVGKIKFRIVKNDTGTKTFIGPDEELMTEVPSNELLDVARWVVSELGEVQLFRPLEIVPVNKPEFTSSPARIFLKGARPTLEERTATSVENEIEPVITVERGSGKVEPQMIDADSLGA